MASGMSDIGDAAPLYESEAFHYKKSDVLQTDHLAKVDYKGKDEIDQAIATLSERAADNEYQLGMVLLASAQQGNKKVYEETLLRMQHALEKLTKNSEGNEDKLSYKAWRLGRMLLASDSINDLETSHVLIIQLKNLLGNLNTQKDQFSAWAWWYLAGHDVREYEEVRVNALDATTALIQQYQKQLTGLQNKIKAKTITKEEELSLQGKRSDALWASVLGIQAAANARDNDTYQQLLKLIKEMMGVSKVTEALQKGLLGASATNDYPAWALGIVEFAAVRMEDKDLVFELQKPFEDALKAARESDKGLAEAILAELNHQLAIANKDLKKSG